MFNYWIVHQTTSVIHMEQFILEADSAQSIPQMNECFFFVSLTSAIDETNQYHLFRVFLSLSFQNNTCIQPNSHYIVNKVHDEENSKWYQHISIRIIH